MRAWTSRTLPVIDTPAATARDRAISVTIFLVLLAIGIGIGLIMGQVLKHAPARPAPAPTIARTAWY